MGAERGEERDWHTERMKSKETEKIQSWAKITPTRCYKRQNQHNIVSNHMCRFVCVGWLLLDSMCVRRSSTLQSIQIKLNRIELNWMGRRQEKGCMLNYFMPHVHWYSVIMLSFFQGKTQTKRNNMVSKTFHFVALFSDTHRHTKPPNNSNNNMKMATMKNRRRFSINIKHFEWKFQCW